MAMVKGEKGKGKDAVGALDAEIDALFQLPATEFTAARNVLVTRLKKAGRGDEAEKVKGLARPPMTAWTVNQLYWKHRDDFQRLITTGERFRVAQASQLAGKSADVRGPLEARRSALADMAKLAASVLREAGGSATPDNMRRITTTLEALSTYGSLPDAPPAGRLTDDVQAPGFETLAALVPRVGDTSRGVGPTRVIQFQHKTPPARSKGKHTAEEDAKLAADERRAKLTAAKAVVQEAERTLSDSRKDAQQAEERLKKAAARAKDAEQEKAEAEKRLEQAAAGVDDARQQARKVAAEAEEAAGALDDAERALEKAKRELAAVESAD